MKSLEISHEFLNHSLELTLKAFREGVYKRNGSDLKNMYFVGAALFLDIQDKNGNEDIITICHSDESFGLFSGGLRRLMPIKAMKTLEILMKEQNINHGTKWA